MPCARAAGLSMGPRLWGSAQAGQGQHPSRGQQGAESSQLHQAQHHALLHASQLQATSAAQPALHADDAKRARVKQEEDDVLSFGSPTIQTEEPLPGGPGVGMHMATWQHLAHHVGSGAGSGGLHNPYPHWQSLTEKARHQAHQAHTPYPQWQSLATKAQDAYTHQVAHPQSQQHPPGYAGEALVAGAAAVTAVGSLYPHWEHLTGKMTSRFGGELVKRERDEERVEETIWHESAPNHPGRPYAKSDPTGCQIAKEETERGLWHDSDSMPNHDPVHAEAECQLIEVLFRCSCLRMCARMRIFTYIYICMSMFEVRFRGSCLLVYLCMHTCIYYIYHVHTHAHVHVRLHLHTHILHVSARAWACM